MCWSSVEAEPSAHFLHSVHPEICPSSFFTPIDPDLLLVRSDSGKTRQQLEAPACFSQDVGSFISKLSVWTFHAWFLFIQSEMRPAMVPQWCMSHPQLLKLAPGFLNLLPQVRNMSDSCAALQGTLRSKSLLFSRSVRNEQCYEAPIGSRQQI